MRLTLAEAARIAGGTIAGGSPLSEAPPGTEAHGGRADVGQTQTSGVSVDSRRLRPGEIFVALRGEYVDGHDYVPEAFRSGASAAVVSRRVEPSGGPWGPLVVVEDPLAALRSLATWVRDIADPLVVGITGSTGKTSTKDLLASVASVKFRTVAAERSHNNELGVPLTLLKTASDTQVLICELGARGPGQIRELCSYVRPQVGVVTNVGVTHYEQFGSRDAIVSAKSELPASLPEGGAAVLNADDPRVAGMARITPADVVTFGTGSGAWLRAEAIELDRRGRPSFRLVRGYERVAVELPLPGRHQVSNALAAAAAGLVLGLSLEEARGGLEAARSSPWRMEVTERGGVVVVNDAYNANPTSMAAALETCAAMVPEGGRLLAVLGYMAELGDLEVPEHEAMGELAARRVRRLVVVGERAAPLAAAAERAGLSDVRRVPGGSDPEAVLAALGEPSPGDVVLVKASRVAALERLAERLASAVEEPVEEPAEGRRGHPAQDPVEHPVEAR